jgi:hypothetical protein
MFSARQWTADADMATCQIDQPAVAHREGCRSK